MTRAFNDDPASNDARAAPQARALTALDVKNAKPRARPYDMADDRTGLHLHVATTGRRTWRSRYFIDGLRKVTTHGDYPAMSLLEARNAHERLHAEVRQGVDPGAEREAAIQARAEEVARTFRVMAGQWIDQMAMKRWKPDYVKEVRRRLTVDAFPAIGDRPIGEVTRNDVITLLERRAATSDAAAANLLQTLNQVFDYWFDRELINRNPAAKLTRRFPATSRAPHPAALTIADARAVLAMTEASTAMLPVKLLLRFQALTCVRPTEAREAVWSEFAPGVWAIPAARMKGRRGRQVGHEVPLSRQAQDVLDVARAVLSDGGPYVFAAPHRGTFAPVARSTAAEVMQRNLAAGGLKHVPHGWRASFSTIMNELHPGEDRVLDAMLAHNTKGAVERRYNRATHLNHVRVRIQEWADLLLAGAPSAWALAGLPAPVTADVVLFPTAEREMSA